MTPQPFLKWVGGKRRILPYLIERAPRDWERYHEPFVGGGALFFALSMTQQHRPAGWAVLSDSNLRLVRTFCAVRDHVEPLIERLRAHADAHSAEHYYKTRDIDIDELDDVSVAAWMIYLNKTGFNGLYRVNRRGKFNVTMGRYSNPCICDATNLRACSLALQGVEIRHEGFEAVASRANTRDFVYFDPPYVPLSRTASFTAYTQDGFDPNAQELLRDLALTLKARGVSVMLSNSDHPRVRQLYGQGFLTHPILVGRAINCRAEVRGKVGELVLSTFQ